MEEELRERFQKLHAEVHVAGWDYMALLLIERETNAGVQAALFAGFDTLDRLESEKRDEAQDLFLQGASDVFRRWRESSKAELFELMT